MQPLPSLEVWLQEHIPDIKEAQAFSIEPLSHDPEKLFDQIAHASAEYTKCGLLLAEAKSFLTSARARASMKFAMNGVGLNANEKKMAIENEVKDIQLLCDQLDVVCRALSNMSYAGMNLRKYYIRDESAAS